MLTLSLQLYCSERIRLEEVLDLRKILNRPYGKRNGWIFNGLICFSLGKATGFCEECIGQMGLVKCMEILLHQGNNCFIRKY